MRVLLVTMANVCPFVPNYLAACTGPEIKNEEFEPPLPDGWDHWDDTCPLPPGCLFGPQYNGCINLSTHNCPPVPRRSYPVLGAWEWPESCTPSRNGCRVGWARHLN